MRAQDLFCAAARVATGHDDQRLGVERVPSQVGGQALQMLDHQRAIQLPRFHLLGKLAGLARDQLDVEPLVRLLEPRHGVGQRAHHRHHGANRDSAGQFGLGFIADAHGVVQAQQVLGLGQQRAAMRVERDRTPGTIEQVATQLGFQRAHLQADGCLRERHTLCSSGKRAVACHGNEGAEKANGAHKGLTSRRRRFSSFS